MNRYKQAAVALGAAIGLLTVSFVLGVGASAILGVSFAPKTSADLAGWAQAVGSIAAIAVAWHLGVGQAKYTRDLLKTRASAEIAATAAAGSLLQNVFISTYAIWVEAREVGLAGGADPSSATVLRKDLVAVREVLRALARSLDRVAQREHMLAQDRDAVDMAHLAAERVLVVLDGDFSDVANCLERLRFAHEDIRKAFEHFQPDSVYLVLKLRHL